MKKGLTVIIIAALASVAATALVGCGNAPASTAALPVAAINTAVDADNNTDTTEAIVTDAITTDTTADVITADDNTADDGFFDVRAAVREDIKNFVKESGANSYTICGICGTHKDVLVLSYGECEMERYYDFYKLDDGEIVPLGTISGYHTVTFIDNMTGKLGLYQAQQGVAREGLIWADGGLRVEYGESVRVAPGVAYPGPSGAELLFTSADDFSMIEAY